MSISLRTRRRVTRPTAKAPGRRRSPRRRSRMAWRFTPWLYLIAPLALLLVFTYVPVYDLLRYSVTDWDGISPDYNYVGFANYTRIFTEPALFKVFIVSMYYIVGAIVQNVLALYLATIFSFKMRLRNLFKGIIFFPYLLNSVAVGFIFLYVFQPGGTLDTIVSLFGLHTHEWLGSPSLDNYSLAGVSVWRYLGLTMVLYIGAIQSISPELYEAAELDGAGRWQQFRYIIAPGIRPIISLQLILAISGAISVFEIPYIMTGGANNTETFVIQTVDLAFQGSAFGLACAMAVILLGIVLVITWLQRRVVPDVEVELT